jgi:hypothetical protein
MEMVEKVQNFAHIQQRLGRVEITSIKNKIIKEKIQKG